MAVPVPQEIPEEQRSVVSYGAAIGGGPPWTVALELLEDL